MKQKILIITFFSALLIGYSQGIEFEQLNWNGVLEKAAQNQKPIFVDVYTTWCRPCKVMSTQVFPLQEVGEVYNSKFICVKMDAEKGEGIRIASDYEVKSYPTYLFLDTSGALILKATGSMPPQEFMALATSAEKELKKPSIIDWENEYALKKTDTTFLRLYMEKRALLGKSNTLLLDEYISLLPENQDVSDDILEFYKKYKESLRINTWAYQKLLDNKTKQTPLKVVVVNSLCRAAINNSLREAIASRDEQLLEEVVVENEKLPKQFGATRKEEIYMNYYKNSNELEKFIHYATLYAETWLMKKELPIISCFELNSIAWLFFEKVTDKEALNNALRWSKRSLEISSDNYMFLDTYANLLYKTGKRRKAISQQTKALNLAIKQNKEEEFEVESYKETLRKMKQREKTWE